jgi:hypothetical protein
LVLRVVFGLVVAAEGAFYIAEPNATPVSWFIGLSAFAAGGLLIVGLLTPIIAALVATGVVGVAVSLLPGCVPTLFDSRTSLILALTILLTIMGLGPGAFSIDARLFGRREIIIPARKPPNPLPE